MRNNSEPILKAKWAAFVVAVAGLLAPVSWEIGMAYYFRYSRDWSMSGNERRLLVFCLLFGAFVEIIALAMALREWRRAAVWFDVPSAFAVLVALLSLGILLWFYYPILF